MKHFWLGCFHTVQSWGKRTTRKSCVKKCPFSSWVYSQTCLSTCASFQPQCANRDWKVTGSDVRLLWGSESQECPAVREQGFDSALPGLIPKQLPEENCVCRKVSSRVDTCCSESWQCHGRRRRGVQCGKSQLCGRWWWGEEVGGLLIVSDLKIGHPLLEGQSLFVLL